MGEANDALVRRFDALEEALAGRDFLCDRFSVADIAGFLLVRFATTLGVAPGESHAKLRAWADRVGARPSVAHEFEAMLRAAASS